MSIKTLWKIVLLAHIITILLLVGYSSKLRKDYIHLKETHTNCVTQKVLNEVGIEKISLHRHYVDGINTTNFYEVVFLKK